jgi:protein-export membrane protein SecD/preprotein translocase SecF subunit
MRHPTTWPLLGITIIVTVICVLFVWPGWPKQYLPDFIDYPEGPILDLGNDAMRLGLDLKGGTYLLTEANLSALPSDRDPDQAMDSVKELMENRVNEFGVAETEVTREGRNRIAIQVPGIPPDQARNLIGRTALLRFQIPVMDDAKNIKCRADDGSEFTVPLSSITDQVNDKGDPVKQCNGTGGKFGTVEWTPAVGTSNGQLRELTGAQVNGANATANIQSSTGWVVVLNFNGEGNTLFEEVTGKLAGGYPLGIFLDDQLISAPAVQQQITGNSTQIENIQEDEAKNLAKLIRAGALPVPLTTIQATEVDATLGEQTLVRGVQAGLIGILAVMAFMILYYRLPGVLASVALFTYIVVVMALFKAIPVTITLAGIAGFVLSVGMAVDANILVFERLKEELRAGRALPSAIEHGFDRAWTSIRDSNVSTLMTCGILWWFGDQFNAALVKGFAITLAIGVIVSLFSAIIVTRTFLRALVQTPLGHYPQLFARDLTHHEAEGSRKAFAFDFIRRRNFYFLLSAAVLIPGLIALIIPPHLETGIEFSSGATFTLRFDDTNVTQDQVKSAFSDLGFGDARIQKTSGGDECANAACFIARTRAFNVAPAPPLGPTPPSERDQVEAGLKERLGNFTTLNFNQVSSIISSSIVWDAIIAVIFASAAITVYITWSFRNVPQSYRYGIAAVVAALHDAMFVVGAFAILGHLFGTEISSLFITGVLTVIGFSVHDTIVVFDRIRENVSHHPGVKFDEVVNASLTETLARSINTSFAVVLTIVAMLLMGGGQINVLLLTLLIGIVSGTYSSIFIASQILVAWEDGDLDPIFNALTFWRRRGGSEPGPEPIAASRA